MKRTTLYLILVAAVLVVAVYFLEIKNAKPRDEKTETTKPAFTFKRDDIASIAITRAGQTVAIGDQDGKWVITQPVNARADEAAIDSIARGIADARVERSLNASPEEIKSFGLSEPAVTIEVNLKSGEQHTLRIGTKDFSELSVYAQLDQQNDVALLPASVLTSADKPLDDLRDRSVLGGVSQYDIRSLTLSNENGRITLAKEGSDWVIKSPIDAPADESEVSSLVSEITSAKAAEFVGENGGDLAKYGLDKPRVTLTAQLAGSECVLAIGSKSEDRYFAKTSERSQVFKVDSSLFDRLNAKASSLRSKEIIKLKEDELARVQIKNPNLRLVAEKGKDDKKDKWIVKEPGDKKDKELSSWKIFNPLETNKATEVLDNPSPAIKAKLAKPAVEVGLTGKDGKTTIIKVSAADGDDVYIRVEGRPAVYKVAKRMLDDLSFKMTDAVP